MRRLLSILLVLGLVLSFSLLTAVPAQGATYNVPGDFSTIQAAITAASYGDTIYVAAGSYNETIDLADGVNVLGEGAGTIIDGFGLSGSVVDASSTSSGTTFSGFTIRNGQAGYGGGMYLDDSSLTVSSCTFTTNSATYYGGGMYILDSSSPVVANCVFQDNTASQFHGGGICCWNSSPIIVNNTIVNNTTDDNGGGIYASPTSSPTITNNIIVSNTATNGGGIYSATATSLPTSYNDVWDNNPNEYYNCTPSNSISLDPVFNDAQYHIIYPDSPCIDVGDNTAADDAGLTTDFEGDPRIFDGDDDGTDTVDMGADEYYVAPPPPPPPHRTVGGEVYPIDKTALLLPWLIAGAALILAASGLILIRRQAR